MVRLVLWDIINGLYKYVADNGVVVINGEAFSVRVCA